MPSQQHDIDIQVGVSLSPSESVNVSKRKAPEGGFGYQEEVCCPCGAGPCTLLESNKAQSKGRHYYICPKDQANRCGFFRWQDQSDGGPSAHKQLNQGQRVDTDEFVPDDSVPDQPGHEAPVQCTCGLPANELTSHSARNPNRVFYRCPKPQDQGQCQFFQWQDELPGKPAAQATASHSEPSHRVTQQSPQNVNAQLSEPAKPAPAAGGSGVFADAAEDWGPQDVTDFDPANPTAWMEGHNYQNAPAPRQGATTSPLSPGHAEPPLKIECECHMQCTYMMAKTQKNNGRWFYRCPRRDEGQCKFFKWADEASQQQPSPSKGAPYGAQASAAPTYHSYASPPKIGAAASGGASSACFKCGQEGHWARDCPGGGGGAQGTGAVGYSGGAGEYGGGGGGFGGGGGSSGSSAPCFKCGQEGHWARDCPQGNKDAGGGFGRQGNSTYGRGGGGQGGGNTGRGSAGACYKCGQSGHFSSNCPN